MLSLLIIASQDERARTCQLGGAGGGRGGSAAPASRSTPCRCDCHYALCGCLSLWCSVVCGSALGETGTSGPTPSAAQRRGVSSVEVSLCGVQTLESKKAQSILHLTSISSYERKFSSRLSSCFVASRHASGHDRRETRVTLGLRCRDRPTRDYREPQPVSRRSTYNNPRPHETVNSSERLTEELLHPPPTTHFQTRQLERWN